MLVELLPECLELLFQGKGNNVLIFLKCGFMGSESLVLLKDEAFFFVFES